MAARFIDVDGHVDQSSIASQSGGTVTADARISWDDTTEPQRIIMAVQKMLDHMVKLESQASALS